MPWTKASPVAARGGKCQSRALPSNLSLSPNLLPHLLLLLPPPPNPTPSRPYNNSQLCSPLQSPFSVPIQLSLHAVLVASSSSSSISCTYPSSFSSFSTVRSTEGCIRQWAAAGTWAAPARRRRSTWRRRRRSGGTSRTARSPRGVILTRSPRT